MSDENAVAEQDEKKLPIAIAIANDVKENISSRKDEIRETVIKNLSDQVITERVKLLNDVLSKRNEIDKEIKKIKPDQVQFDIDGKKIGSSFTKSAIEGLNKSREKLAKIDKAITKAIENADYEDIKKLK